MSDLLTFLGAIAVLIPWASGAYQWLRWGYVGQKAIWSIRETLDVEVCAAVKDAVVKVNR